MTLPEERDDDRNPRKKLYQVPKPELLSGAVPLEEGVLQIRKAIDDYLSMPDPGHILLIAAPPGSRKTSILVELAELRALDAQRVFYIGPRHEHYNDVRQMQQHPDLWQEWFPKQLANELENKHETCRYADRQAQWTNKGWNSRTYCEHACRHIYMAATCVWHGQTRTAVKKQKDLGGYIVYGQHQHIFTKFPLAFDLMIVDECPKSAVENTWEIPWQKIVPHDLPTDSPFRAVLIAMRDMVQANKSINIKGAPLMAALGGWRHVMDSMDVLLPLREAMAPDQINDPNADYAHIWDVQRILKDEASAAVSGQDYVARIALEEGNLVLTMRKNVDDKLPGHVICLDATGQADLYREIFGRPVEVVAPAIALQGKITQVWTNTWSRSSLFDYDEKGKKTEAKDHWEKAQLIVDEIASRYETVGFISYKDVYRKMAPANAVELGYFGGERGTNRFVPMDVIIVLGNPNPQKDRIEAEATSFFSKRMRPFRLPDGTLPWKKKLVPYRHVAEDGYGRAVDTLGYWDDPDLQVILEQAREAELYQSVHRLRLLTQNKPVFLVTNIPIWENVDVISIAEVFNAPINTDPYVWGKVKKFARERHDIDAPLVARDLSRECGIQKIDIALRLLRYLVIDGHWRSATRKEVKAAHPDHHGQLPEGIMPC